jgi:hypothetical protein
MAVAAPPPITQSPAYSATGDACAAKQRPSRQFESMTSVLSFADIPSFRLGMDHLSGGYVSAYSVLPGQQTGSKGNGSDDDKPRNKLNYLRAPVACLHCRRRKIRCKPKEVQENGRCDSCVKLDRECVYLPVSEEMMQASATQQHPASVSHGRGITRNYPSFPRKKSPHAMRRVGSVPIFLPMDPPIPASMLDQHQFPDSGVPSSEPSPRNPYEYVPSCASDQASASESGDPNNPSMSVSSLSTGYLHERPLSPTSQVGHPIQDWAHSNGDYGPPHGYPYPTPERSMSLGGEPTGVYSARSGDRILDNIGHYNGPSVIPPILHDGGISAAPLDPSIYLPAPAPYSNWTPSPIPTRPPYPPYRHSIDGHVGWYVDERPGSDIMAAPALPTSSGTEPANTLYPTTR